MDSLPLAGGHTGELGASRRDGRDRYLARRGQEIGPITPGRYLIRNESAPNGGQYFLLEPDKTIVPVDAF